jgi:hypothetical protein
LVRGENHESGIGFLCMRESCEQLKRVEFASDRMPCIILRGRQYHIIVLNVCALTEDKTDDVIDSFCKEFEHVFDRFTKYHMKVLLRAFNAKVGLPEASQ